MIALIITCIIGFGIVYLFVRVYLSQSYTFKGIKKYVLLFIIGYIINVFLLYIYSILGVESDTFKNIGILSAVTSVLWLELKKDPKEFASPMQVKAIFVCSIVLAVLPIVLTVYFY